MRPSSVLVYGRTGVDSAESHCVVALRSMGIAVGTFDPDTHPAWLAPLRRTWKSKRWVNPVVERVPGLHRGLESSLIAHVRRTRPDLVLILSITDLSPECIAALRNESRVVGWYQDHVVNFGRHLFLLAPYHQLFFKDPYIVSKLRDGIGATNVHFLPEACEPTVHRPAEPSAEDRLNYECDVLVYGNMYVYRVRLLERLLDQGFNIRLFGNSPPLWLKSPARKLWQGRGITGDEKGRAIACAKIVLSSSHFGEVESANARIFETAGIGGFQLADAPGVATYFEPGREIALFRGPEDLLARIRHYLNAPSERAAIAAAGRERALRDHTFVMRLERMFEIVFA